MQHLDEGTIHAWLDGALTPDEARALEAHIGECPSCAAMVADARGVLAAASRILSALDTVPAGVLPSAGRSVDERATIARESTRSRRPFRAARWRAAAAFVLVAGSSWLVIEARATRKAGETPSASSVAPAAADTVTLGQIPPAVATAPTAGHALDMAQTRERASSAEARPRGTIETNKSASSGQDSEVRMSEPPRAERRAALADASGNARAQRSALAADAIRESDRKAVAQSLPESRLSSAAPLAAAGAASSGGSAVGGARADNAAPASAPGLAKSNVEQQSYQPRATTIVIDHAYVDSVLAADSAFETPQRLELGYSGGNARRAKTGATTPQAAAPSTERLRTATDFTERAVGCYTVDTTAWLPRARGETEPVSLMPARIELRRDRGLSGDEWGNLLARPAPGESPLPAGAVGFWKPLGNDKVRVTFADNTSWVSLTLVVDENAIAGPARAYSPGDDRLRTARISGRRVLCRTEP